MPQDDRGQGYLYIAQPPLYRALPEGKSSVLRQGSVGRTCRPYLVDEGYRDGAEYDIGSGERDHGPGPDLVRVVNEARGRSVGHDRAPVRAALSAPSPFWSKAALAGLFGDNPDPATAATPHLKAVATTKRRDGSIWWRWRSRRPGRVAAHAVPRAYGWRGCCAGSSAIRDSGRRRWSTPCDARRLSGVSAPPPCATPISNRPRPVPPQGPPEPRSVRGPTGPGLEPVLDAEGAKGLNIQRYKGLGRDERRVSSGKPRSTTTPALCCRSRSTIWPRTPTTCSPS